MIKKIEAEMAKANDEMRRLLEMKKKAEDNLLQISKYSPLTSLKTKKHAAHKPRPDLPEPAEPKTRDSSPAESRKALSVTYSDFSTKRPASHPKKPQAGKPEARQTPAPRAEVPRLKTSLKKLQSGAEGVEAGVETSRSLSSRRNPREEPFSQTLPQEPAKSEQSKLSRSLRSSSSVKKVSFDIPAPHEPQLHSRGKSETARSGRTDQPTPGPSLRSPEKPDLGSRPASRQASAKKQPARVSVEKRLVFELSVSRENKHRGSVEFYDPSTLNDPTFVRVHENQFETLGGQQAPEAASSLADRSARPKPQKTRAKQPDRAVQAKKPDSADSLAAQKDATAPRKKDPAATVEFKPVRADHSRKKVPATFTKPAPEEAAARPGKSPKPEAAKEKTPAPKWNGSAKVAPQFARDARPQPLIQESTRNDARKADPLDRSASRKSDRSQASSGKPRRQSLEEEWALKKPQRNPRRPPARLDPASLPPGTRC